MPGVTIKNIPEELLERLRERARANHRSLQGELLSILEEADAHHGTITVDEAARRIRALNLIPRDEAAALVRADRDARAGR